MPPEAAVANPAPYLYDTTMQAMAGLVVVAGLVHYSIGPIDQTLFSGNEVEKEKEEPLMVIDVEKRQHE